MLIKIIKDLLERFGSTILAGLLVIVALWGTWYGIQSKFPSFFGPTKDQLAAQVKEQTAVIDTVTQAAEAEHAKATINAAVQEQAKNDLVNHISQQQNTAKAFDTIKANLNSKINSSQRVTQKVPPATPGNSLQGQSTPSGQIDADLLSDQQATNDVQESIWAAYELANKDHDRQPL